MCGIVLCNGVGGARREEWRGRVLCVSVSGYVGRSVARASALVEKDLVGTCWVTCWKKGGARANERTNDGCAK